MLISDPQVVRWANERARTLTSELAAIYDKMKDYQTDYAAQGINAQIVAAGNTNVIDDHSDVDGRSQITGLNIQNLTPTFTQLIAAFDATVAGVGTSAIAALNLIEVEAP